MTPYFPPTETPYELTPVLTVTIPDGDYDAQESDLRSAAGTYDGRLTMRPFDYPGDGPRPGYRAAAFTHPDGFAALERFAGYLRDRSATAAYDPRGDA